MRFLHSRTTGLARIAAMSLMLASFGAAMSTEALTYRDCPECPLMVRVPGGSTMMGLSPAEMEREGLRGVKSAADEVPSQRISVGGFSLGAFEVTKGEFAAFVRATNYNVEGPCVLQPEYGHWTESEGHDWKNLGFAQGSDHPAACVNWNDAKAYAQWLSKRTGKAYRLPSEAEWEYAARAGTSTQRYWGDQLSVSCKSANGVDIAASRVFTWLYAHFPCDDGYVYTSPVGSFEPNRFGLHDMLGNVWEWTEDCYNNSIQGTPSDGSARLSGHCDQRVSRGGSWMDTPRVLRVSTRTNDEVNRRFNFKGFRVARD